MKNLKILLDRLVGQDYIIVEARKGIFEKLIEKEKKMKNDEERGSVTIDLLMILLDDECHYAKNKVRETADGFAPERCITTAEAI